MLAQLRELSDAHERLLELHRDLLTQYAALLQRPTPAATTAELRIGPFADGAAVRAFIRALVSLPGVEDVDVREYLDGGRVLIEARLLGGGGPAA